MCDGPSLNDDPRRARTADRQRVIVVDAVRAARAGSAFGVARLSRPVGSHSVMPPTTAILLESVPPHRGGVASGVFNTSRQVGGGTGRRGIWSAVGFRRLPDRCGREHSDRVGHCSAHGGRGHAAADARPRPRGRHLMVVPSSGQRESSCNAPQSTSLRQQRARRTCSCPGRTGTIA